MCLYEFHPEVKPPRTPLRVAFSTSSLRYEALVTESLTSLSLYRILFYTVARVTE